MAFVSTQLRDRSVLAVVREDVVDEVERGLDAGDFSGVAPALDEERGLVGVRAGLLVGDRDLPQLPAFERLADRVQLDEIRIRRRPLPQQHRRFLIAVEVLEVDLALFERLHLRIGDARKHGGAVTLPAGDAIHLLGRPTRPILRGDRHYHQTGCQKTLTPRPIAITRSIVIPLEKSPSCPSCCKIYDVGPPSSNGSRRSCRGPFASQTAYDPLPVALYIATPA